MTQKEPADIVDQKKNLTDNQIIEELADLLYVANASIPHTIDVKPQRPYQDKCVLCEFE